MERVFVSHRRPEQPEAERLRERAGDRWEFVTHPIKRELAATWQADCLRLIAGASFVVCIVGDSTAASENVKWELEQALELGRPVLALRSEHAAAPELPEPLASLGYELIEMGDLALRLREVALERAG